jgi:glycosyltransferase involved in cell wall biosynthesis
VKEFLTASLPLLQEFPKLRLLVVGDPTRGEQDSLQYAKELEELIEKSPHQDRVHRFPHQQKFLSLMHCLNILVMPSYQETYSLLILNAFALGIPVLSTNEGGTPDLIGEAEQRGWLVPAKSSEAVQKKMRTLIQSPQQVLSKVSSCVDEVESHHSHLQICEDFLKAYQSQM